ncbi:tRNA preQ1(34) S-adenosylmethionine ribosyltransferase-isomerase QueA [Leptodesmis sichuanensis]|uniref:tRNA preQ1(34) S-adenosylmethionine ribosyltransferase-isomerase QueA n=1 Tax=Leptodesmis sichuanensis TaxID=2906798 RepID=UPI001F020382|nr:tRNA preQ1(34) S-adenosylmethionine ribosyltransferase-isomerase QueA [Leptodesmis sichuanensis]UIE37433.1 tRNA preQ1(34) S-adenosylmethionine ribosyltransferase-isomerase QueA [Leptodesmis sichuanensis A121]
MCPVDCDRLLSAYDYTLPPDRIAQAPVVPRDSARLLVVKDANEHTHAIFRDLPQLLKPGDLLVLNNTRVLPARLYGHKPSGLSVEILLLEPQPDETPAVDDFATRWLALVKPGRRLKPGAEIWFKGPSTDAATDQTPLKAKVLASDPTTSGRIIEFQVPPGQFLKDWLYEFGQVPLPPYISNPDTTPDQYQTVYADRLGAVAAPTAGLHFTPELLQRLDDRGIQKAFVTLHVGVGTFRPVEAEDITQHQMHAEWAEVSQDTVDRIRQTQAQGGRVIAVGTTVVRSLEAAAQSGTLQPLYGKTNLFIYPGYQWQVIDGLITNFHLPKSSLMMLVSALIGRQRLLDLYQVAIEEGYRFYSFGDAMLILPEAKRPSHCPASQGDGGSCDTAQPRF